MVQNAEFCAARAMAPGARDFTKVGNWPLLTRCHWSDFGGAAAESVFKKPKRRCRLTTNSRRLELPLL